MGAEKTAKLSLKLQVVLVQRKIYQFNSVDDVVVECESITALTIHRPLYSTKSTCSPIVIRCCLRRAIKRYKAH